MRLTSFEIGTFGALHDRRMEMDQPAVVVLGPNEAGKSTLFHFFRAMLYGFYPANREQYGFVPWSGDAPVGTLRFRLDDGVDGSVSRRLLSTPQGVYQLDGAERDLRNQSLPPLAHIDRRVFDAVYALTLHNLVEMEDGAWGEIQDRLLGGMNIDFIRPARVVVAEIEEEAKALWRSSGRGKPIWRELQKEHRRLRDRRQEAFERERSLRERDATLAEKERELAEIVEVQTQLQINRRKAERLRPVRTRLLQIAARLTVAGDEEDLRDLPAEPGQRLRELAVEADARRRELEALELRKSPLEEIVIREEPADRPLLDHQAQIRLLDKGVSAHLDRMNRVTEAREHVARLEGALRATAAEILTRWDEEAAAAIASAAEPDLRGRAEQFTRADEAVRNARMREEAWLESHIPPMNPVLSGILAAIGGVGAAVAWGYDRPLWVGTLLVLGLAGVGLLVHALNENRRRRKRTEASPLARLEAERDRHRATVARLVESVPFPPGRLDHPDQTLVYDVSRLQQALSRIGEEQKRLRRLEEAVREEEGRAGALAERCGLTADTDLPDVAARLLLALEDADQRQREVARARDELEQLGPQIAGVREQIAALEEENSHLGQRLRLLGGGDVESGAEAYRKRSRAAEAVRAFQEELEKEFPDWRDVEQEIVQLEEAGDSERLTDEDMVRLANQIEEFEERRHVLAEEIGSLRQELKNLEEGATIDQIDSELSYLETQQREVERGRDRLQLLARVVRRADETYREKHQPDVLRRASAYLKAVTGDRYVRLSVEDGTTSLRVTRAETPFPLVVGESLSQGTRDQIYLALRLAIADHLDEGRERLPIFLDETYVNWDEHRRRQGLALLKDLSRQRQVFLFTCHPWLAAEAAATCAASVVELTE